MLNNVVIFTIETIVGNTVDKFWFHQDGVQVHFVVIVRDFLKNLFGRKWIDSRGTIERSPM